MHNRTSLALASLLAITVSCGGPGGVECKQDEDCNLETGGRCDEYEGTGHSWCSYPDPACADGRRWSDFNTGDGLSGECQVAMIDANGTGGDGGDDVTLTVSLGGNGTGTVTSDPPGIDCASGQCSAAFPAGTDVMLTATPSGSVFLGWAEACTGSGGCTVSLTQDAEVGALFGVPGESLWFDQIGNTLGDKVLSVAVDGSGDVLIAGFFSGTMDVAGQSLTSDTSQDLYVAKLDGSTGLATWAVHFAPTSGIGADDLAVDSAGNVLVIGNFGGSVNFGGGTLTATSADVYVLKLSGVNGSYIWAQRFGGAGIEFGYTIAVDHADNVVFGGAYKCASLPCTSQPTINLGGSTFTNAGQEDLIVAKISGSNGAHVWSKALGAGGRDITHSIGVDSDNNVVVTGEFSLTVNFGGAAKVSAGNVDIFIAKYAAADGAHLYSERYGSTSSDIGIDLAVGPANQTFLLGSFGGTVNFGGAQSLTATGASAPVLAKYTQAGAHAWSRTFSVTDSIYANGLAAIPGGVTMIGSFCGTVTLNEDLTSAGSCPDNDVLLAEFSDTTGAAAAAVRHGGTGSEIGYGVAMDAAGHIFGAGAFSGFAEFGGDAYTSAGSTDGYVVALGPLQ